MAQTLSRSIIKCIFQKIILWAILIVSSLSSEAHKLENSPLKIIVSFSILQDFTQQITGDVAQVASLVPLTADPHVYEPSPADGRALTKADIVILNGLGFECHVEKLVRATTSSDNIIIATQDIKPRILQEGTYPVQDPHAWNDVKNAISYVKTITTALCQRFPQLATTFQINSQNFINALEKTDQQIKALFLNIPTIKKQVLTTHDAFWYFGQAYGIAFLSPVGITTKAEASAAQVAHLIQWIRRNNITAIFIEKLANEKLVAQIAQECKVPLQGTLYADTLSTPDGPAGTYIKMMLYNAHAIAKALMFL